MVKNQVNAFSDLIRIQKSVNDLSTGDLIQTPVGCTSEGNNKMPNKINKMIPVVQLFWSSQNDWTRHDRILLILCCNNYLHSPVPSVLANSSQYQWPLLERNQMHCTNLMIQHSVDSGGPLTSFWEEQYACRVHCRLVFCSFLCSFYYQVERFGRQSYLHFRQLYKILSIIEVLKAYSISYYIYTLVKKSKRSADSGWKRERHLSQK